MFRKHVAVLRLSIAAVPLLSLWLKHSGLAKHNVYYTCVGCCLVRLLFGVIQLKCRNIFLSISITDLHHCSSTQVAASKL